MKHPRLRATLVLSLAALVVWAPSAGAGLASSVWPKFQHDAQNTGRTTVDGPQGPSPEIAWTFRGDSRIGSAPSVGADGTLYVGNGKRPLTAVDPDTGLEIWSANVLPVIGTTKAGLAERSQPAVSEDGTIYLGARDNRLWSIFDNGEVDWFYKVLHDGDVTTPPTVHPNGTIYMGSAVLGAGWLFGVSPAGVATSFAVLGGSLKNASPAISSDGSRVFVSIKREAIALNASDLSEIWRCVIGDKGFGSRTPNYSPVVYNDGNGDQNVYFAGKDGVFAFDPNAGEDYDCTPRWLFTPPNPVGATAREEFKSAPAIGPDGTVYIGASKSKKSSTFYAIDPTDGSLEWQHQHIDDGQYVNNQAAIGADGTVYVGYGRTLYAFAGQGNGSGGSAVKWSMLVPGKLETGPMIGAQGALYAAVGKSLFKITD